MKHIIITMVISLTALLLAGVFIAAPQTQANTPITVNSTADEVDATPGDGICASTPSGQCTLRAAIMEANALAGADTINVPAGVYTFTIPGIDEDAGVTGDLDITDEVTLTGVGAETTVIDGGGIDRVMDVTGTVTIEGVTIRGGDLPYSAVAGIQSRGALTISNSNVINNSGAGLSNDYGTLSVLNSIVASNTLGGVDISRGSAVIDHSYFSANYFDDPFSERAGTGLTIEGGIVSITNSTLTDNVDGKLYALYAEHSTVSIANSLVANNSGGLYFFFGNIVSIRDSVFLSNTTTGNGGAIAFVDDGRLSITDSQFISNSAPVLSQMFGGGAIWFYAAPEMIISNSVFVDNYSNNDGGAILASASNHITINDSTFSGNRTAQSGGAIWDSAPIELNNATIVSNLADVDHDGFGQGGGLSIHPYGVVSFANTLVAGNSDWAGAAPDCFGTLNSLGYNLIQDSTGCVITGTLTGVITNTDPLLGSLQNNGGPTLTHALLPGSLAIDAGNPAGCTDAAGNPLVADQRGFIRATDGDGNGSAVCDIGAYEYNSIPFLQLFLPFILR